MVSLAMKKALEPAITIQIAALAPQDLKRARKLASDLFSILKRTSQGAVLQETENGTTLFLK